VSNATRPVPSLLICDDTEAIRLLLRIMIERSSGIRVVGEAADGEQVIAAATRLQPDVILLDLAMPTRTGLDALPELRQVAPRAAIIVFSGFAGASVVEQALARGADHFLQKGAAPTLILATIEQCLGNRRAPEQAIAAPEVVAEPPHRPELI
jgi:DNA-binding NarL/FixJ family response regulator